MELIHKDQQFNGFRQVWTERPDGVFHGSYTVYWESGPILCLRGQYHHGQQEGLWTYWDRAGKVERQARFENDEEVESRTEPPWLNQVE